jgi:lactoylglutathione lyase
MKLSNVRLLVNDLNVSLAFYRDTLGFPVLLGGAEEMYVELTVGEGVTLALFGREHMAQAIGTTHRAPFAECQDTVAIVFSVENVDEAAAQLQAKGITLEAEVQNRDVWEIRTAHFRDPDGNLIEIYGPLKK